jgi:membrane-bound lytic murein transglycosylase A
MLAGCASFNEKTNSGLLLPQTEKTYAEQSPQKSMELAEKLNPGGQRLNSWTELAPAIKESLAYTQKQNQQSVAIAKGDMAITWDDVHRCLLRLEELLPRLDKEPELLADQFIWINLSAGADFSGYYEPLLKASKTRKPGFTHPLYKVPPDLKIMDLGAFRQNMIGQRLIYRLDGDKAVPYYSRMDIDGKNALSGKGLELAWTPSAVDAFFLQVQGSGRLVFEDGKEQPILFAQHNGRPYVALGRRMRDMGLIEYRDTGLEAIRNWFASHPERMREIMDLNENYVFFRFAPVGPIGNMGGQLSPWVSLSVDRALIPLGAPLIFNVDAPRADGSVSSVFGIGLAQDTLGAIKGHRIDIFCGRGESAEYEAGHLNTPGSAWLLLAR